MTMTKRLQRQFGNWLYQGRELAYACRANAAPDCFSMRTSRKAPQQPINLPTATAAYYPLTPRPYLPQQPKFSA